jgi:DNA-binding CsgD family transcriptional regulator
MERNDMDLIERIAQEHGLSTTSAKAVVDDVQSDADVALVCSECGDTEDDGARVVSAFRDPTDGERRALCDSCFAGLLESRTLLSPQQARILPLMLAGWGTTEIADALGIDRPNVSVQKSKIRGREDDAIEQLKEARSTLAALEDLTNEETNQ